MTVAAARGRTRCSTPPTAARRSSVCPRTSQAEAFDFPVAFFERGVHEIAPARGPTAASSSRPPPRSRGAEKPLIIAGGGVHYSGRRGRAARRSPSATTSPSSRPSPARHVAAAVAPAERRADRRDRLRRRPTTWPAEADVVLAVGTRLAGLHHRFVDACSRTRRCRSSGSTPHGSMPPSTAPLPLVGRCPRGARPSCRRALGDCRAGDDWTRRAAAEVAQYHAYIDKIAAPDGGRRQRAADLRPGGRRRRPQRPTRRLRACRRRRLPR